MSDYRRFARTTGTEVTVASPQNQAAIATAIPEHLLTNAGMSVLQLLAIMRAYRRQIALIAVSFIVARKQSCSIRTESLP